MDSMAVLKRIIAIILAAAALAPSALAQETYRYEVGGGVGMSGYIGDACGKLMQHPGWAAGGIFRYVIDRRWSLKANLTVASIGGSSDGISYPGGAVYEFNSTLYDAGAQMEFNFFNFGIGSKYMNLKRITPYLTVGLGGVFATPDTGSGNSFAIVLPMGVGVKYKWKERLNLGLEFTMRKSFGDGIDGLSDLNGIRHSFAKNTDWYSVLMVSVTYEFGKRCKVCHYVE